MAAPASAAFNFHNRFDPIPEKDAALISNPVPSEAAHNPRSSADNYSYPDLNAGKVYSSGAPHAAAAPALSALPDFPEFKSFDSESEVFQSNNLFQQFAPHSAALVEPQSAQIEGSPSDEQLHSTSVTGHEEISAKPTEAATTATESHEAPAEAIGVAPALQNESQQEQVHSQQQPEAPEQPQLERHFSSASSYVQQPSLHTGSHDSQAQSQHSHIGQRSPLPKPPAMPISPPAQLAQTNGAPQAQQAESASTFTFPPQQAPPAVPASLQPQSQYPQHQPPTQQPPTQQAPETLNMNGVHLNGGERSGQQLPSSQTTAVNRDDDADRPRPSSFFGMQRPAAGINGTGQHVPIPASMLANDDDGFYQDQQHLSQPNGIGLPQQHTRDSLHQGPRPSSFFGMQGDMGSSLPSESVIAPSPVGEGSSPGMRGSAFLRNESMPRGISTAAGGTGNGPMPSSGGFGGLGPAGANRPASIAPSVASGPLLDHSHLKVGQKASLLSHGKTLELYRQNAKKTNDPNLIYELSVFMIDAAKTMGTEEEGKVPQAVNGPSKVDTEKEELIKEATGLLKKIADRGHPDAQYFLADCYANGLGTRTGKQDFGQAYTYFVLAAKHGHPDAAYRAGTCYEKGWGCRKDAGKALQFYRKSAAQSHPGAMYRLATAELNGELGLKKNAKEGVKWLKRSAEAATPEFPHALHELALLHERGIDNVLFVDSEYSCELLAQAGEMGYAPSAYKLGVNYEYGRMGCPQDGGLSIHMYNIAAQQNHKEACFALTAWYLVGAPGILPQSDTEAYLWAKKAAEQGLAKAEYAVGYFTEMGIGTVKDLPEAKAWYKKAADHGDKRANQRIAALQGRGGGPNGLAGVGATPTVVNRSQLRMEQRNEQRESMHEFGRRAQPTSAPFPASVTQSSMAGVSTSYPTPLAMREAQTAQREQQYMANVAAHERAQARAMLRSSPTQQEVGGGSSPASMGPPMGLPRPPQMPQQQQQGSSFGQGQAYPSYPMSASTAPPQPSAPAPNQQGMGMHNPMFPPSSGPGSQFMARPMGPGGSPMGPPGPAPPAKAEMGGAKEEDKKKKKGWFGRS